MVLPFMPANTSTKPASVSSSTVESGRLQAALTASGGRAGKVLVVDDDPGLRRALAISLSKFGYEVTEAADGESCLGLARDDVFDLILLDVTMPGMDGYAVCRRLKEETNTRLTPVVFLTGLDDREARLEGLQAGASDFLNKPFDLVELEVRVHNLIAAGRLTRDLVSADEIIFSIARAVETRDEGTGGHCERLAHLAVRFGRRLNLDEDQLVTLHRAGYLHDIGKIGVPDAVLLKSGKLTGDEWEIMRSHVELGARICAPLRTMRPVLPIIRHHHERYDGSGYPDGLSGEEIPYLARVFQIVDIFDALTNQRSYREALSTAQALELIREETDRGWWDPGKVEAFCELMGDHPRPEGTKVPPLERTKVPPLRQLTVPTAHNPHFSPTICCGT